tara:strand:+ start:3841 stop:4017 length:177 start_codon:yes stop_codon:yes gene_type:complete
MSNLNLKQAECDLIVKALNRFGNRKEASKSLGISARVLGKLISNHKIISYTQKAYKVK